MDSGRERHLDREIKQYREAAIHALEHLEWTASYLRKIRKSELANALDRNRKQIIERITADGN